jgi:neutral ceramidase
MAMKIRMTALLLSVMAVAASLLAGGAHAGPLRAGAAKLDITAMAYKDGKVPAAKYGHEHLYIRAIVLDSGDTRAVLIGSDLSFIRPDEAYTEAAAQIARELNLPQQNILMSATHTHSGVDNEWLIANPKKLAEALVQATRAAQAKLRPAKVGFGEGTLYLNTNRDAIDEKTRLWTQDPNPDGPSDKTLAVLAFYDDAGRPIAGYMNYAMHPINGYLSGFISSDFAGAASLHVEKAFGDEMIMVFSQGAQGDQMPLHLRNSTNQMAALSGVRITGFEFTREVIETPLREGKVPRGRNDPAADDASKNWMNVQGQMIGEEAIRVMSHMRRLDSDVKIGGRLMTLTCPGRDWTNSKGARAGNPGTYADGEDVRMRLGVLGINDIVLASINAEPYNLIGQQVKAASPLKKTMFVGVANGRANSGYIPTDDAYGRYTFQVVASRLKPGCAQAGIVKGITDMIYDYAK